MSERGLHIIFDGPDGVGKTTQIEILVSKMRDLGRNVLSLREPGGTPIGRGIRAVVLDATLERSALTNVLLFTADRHEQWVQRTKPALESGIDVVTDRSWLSTAAFQGGAEGIGIDEVHEITARFMPEEYMNPDLAFLLLGLNGGHNERIDSRGGREADTFESRGRPFMDTVVRGYIQAARLVPGIIGIEADRTVDEVHEEIWREVELAMTRTTTKD